VTERGVEFLIPERVYDRVKQARDESHDVRREIPAVRLDTLYEEDELYCVWLQFFTDVLPEEYL
jgi:hypothetical protein